MQVLVLLVVFWGSLDFEGWAFGVRVCGLRV